MLSNGSVIFFQWIGFDVHRHAKLPCFPIVSGCSPELFSFFFIYLYFHLWMLSDDSVISPGVPASMSSGPQKFSFLSHPEGIDV